LLVLDGFLDHFLGKPLGKSLVFYARLPQEKENAGPFPSAADFKKPKEILRGAVEVTF